ncbi:MAG: hypothetical protein GWP74_16880 [Proteobacteria bacterium]|nr:hypothetical protein [Pseudomonadota bacterium]
MQGARKLAGSLSQDAYQYLESVINPDHWWKLDETTTQGPSYTAFDAVGGLNLTYTIGANPQPGMHDGRVDGAAYLYASASTDYTISGGVPWATHLGAFSLAFTYQLTQSDTSSRSLIFADDNESATKGEMTFIMNNTTGVVLCRFYTRNGSVKGTQLVFTCNTFVAVQGTIYDIVFAWARSAGDATDAYFVINGVEYTCTLDVGTYTETEFYQPADFRIARGDGSNDGPKVSRYDDVWTASVKVPPAQAITYHDKLVEMEP